MPARRPLRRRLPPGRAPRAPAQPVGRSRAGGLSGDRRTLVLIEPRQSFPRATTSLLVLDVPALRVRARIYLRGDFSFDAVWPGRFAPLPHRLRLAARADALLGAQLLRPAMRLDTAPVVDPRSPGEKMRGNGAGGTPFIHALDTVNATARCIDLDGLDLSIVDRLRLRLEHRDRAVDVVDGRRTILRLDTRTFVVDQGCSSLERHGCSAAAKAS